MYHMQTAWIQMRCRVTWIQAVSTQTTFSPTLSDIEALLILKQMRNSADNNLFSVLRAYNESERLFQTELLQVKQEEHTQSSRYVLE